MANEVRFNPDTTDTAARARELQLVGWRGSFPSTPCRSCNGEWFLWNGDWGMGYRCTQCGQTWREA